MLYLGKQITSPDEILQPVAVEKIYKALLNSEGTVAVLLQRLQAIRMIDVNQYRKLKTNLPFLVCALFQPRIRKKENFIYTERFIIDIDHLSAYEIDVNKLKETLRQDSRVELFFTSPSGDGLKVLFVLQDKIEDSAYYSLFYKSFCLKFSEQYKLEGALDAKTHDVSRCCFVSFDPDAYYNPNAEKIQASLFMPNDDLSDLELFHSDLKQKEKEIKKEQKAIGISTESKGGNVLPDNILNQIKQKVGVRVRAPKEKTYEQPEQLDSIISEIVEQLSSIEVRVLQMKPIAYGRQIKIGIDRYWAEINIFYGQKGVRIVGTTKTGSNKQLCDQAVLLLNDYFEGRNIS